MLNLEWEDIETVLPFALISNQGGQNVFRDTWKFQTKLLGGFSTRSCCSLQIGVNLCLSTYLVQLHELFFKGIARSC